MEQLGRAQVQLREAVRELAEAQEELRRAREELKRCEQSEVEEDTEGREEMLLALHSLAGVIRLLSPKPALETADDEDPVSDQVSPLPGEQKAASREDQIMGRRAMRRRWRTDLPVEGRAALTRNTSAQQLPSTSKDGSQGGDQRNTPALPRTLSTSVLRIKQRRSFWEKFVQ